MDEEDSAIENDRLRSKDTRWDRIRKRHMNSLTVKTETVKKIIAMDFVSNDQMKKLSISDSNKKILDPVLVMNLRHEVVRRKTPRNRVITRKDLALENTKAHNRKVEDHYIENQLSKLKIDLKKSRQRANCRPRLCLNLNNDAIYESLDNCNKHTIDFYRTVEKALEGGGTSQPTVMIEEEITIVQETEPTAVENASNEKVVRFEDSVEIINYSHDELSNTDFSSNTSSDVDSVISDVAEDVVHEVQMEIEMIGKSFESLQTLPIAEMQTSEENNKQENLKGSPKPQLEFTSTEPLTIVRIQPTEIKKSPRNDSTDVEESITVSKSSETISKEQDAIISELFNSRMKRNEKLLRKYFLRWTHSTTISKIEKMNLSNKNDRFQKINMFLDKIRREKRLGPKEKSTGHAAQETKENSIMLAKKYQNKIKVQQDIIDLQKLKLERQERLIMELKLNKILQEHKQSRDGVKQELKAVIKTGDTRNRIKAKCLQVAGNLRDDEDKDEFARLQGKSLMMPKFLVNMQERAMLRNMKHEQAKQRRLQAEAEREAIKIAAEDAKRLEDEEAKRKRIEALKEKRRQEKLAKLERERERLRCIENNKKYQEYRRRWLLRRIGMEGFRRLLTRKRKFQKKAEIHRKFAAKRKIFKAWRIYVLSVWERKIKVADRLYEKIVKQIAFRQWTIYHWNERSKWLVAIDWYELRITEAIFQQWVGITKLQKLIYESKRVQAVSHYNWSMKWKVLDHWRRLPQVLKIEKETEERRLRWRMKIWELLPDYKPNIEQ